MSSAIKVDQLGKCYQLTTSNGERAAYKTLRESVSEGLSSLLKRKRTTKEEPFWALKDISFEVPTGGVVGIIGHNGAGKSTLLKILSRITKPTTGQFTLRGRVGSLLEVGTGFHPELTGRENIYLNGSILGMSKKEITRRFDEIVAFAEVEKFLDTPVKRYSSGMYVRLAFAVAAHLEPEILIVDEVLAVGDATYQRRCIERMSELARSGMTVLFVSHNMELVPRLCKQGVMLNRGRVEMIGPASDVVNHYMHHLVSGAAAEDLTSKRHKGDGRAQFTKLRMVDGKTGQATPTFSAGTDLVMQMEIDAKEAVSDAAIAVVLLNLYGTRIVTSWNREANFAVNLKPGKQVVECRFKDVNLRPGHSLQVHLWMATDSEIDVVDQARIIDIVATPETMKYSTDTAQGIVLCEHVWQWLPENALS